MAPNQALEVIDADGHTFSDAVTRLRLSKPVGAIRDIIHSRVFLSHTPLIFDYISLHLKRMYI